MGKELPLAPKRSFLKDMQDYGPKQGCTETDSISLKQKAWSVVPDWL